jgi:hypothetical protein
MLKTIKVDKLLVAAGDYAAEDVMSDSTTATNHQYWYFPNVVKKGGDFGKIVKCTIIWTTTALTPRITLYLFKEPPTMELRDNVANTSPGATDRYSFQGQIDQIALEDMGGMSASTIDYNTYGNLPLLFQTAPGNTGLYALAVTRDAIVDEASTVMTIALTVSDKVED